MSDYLTKKEFETWKRDFEKRKSAGAVTSGLLLPNGGRYEKPLIQNGVSSGASSATITFGQAFKTGTTPTVVACSAHLDCHCQIYSVSNSAVTIRNVDTTTHGLRVATFYWVAIGIAP